MFKSTRTALALLIGALGLSLVTTVPVGAISPAKVPHCIVSLSPTATDTLFTIGAGPQVQAVDKDATFPAKGLPSRKIDALNPSIESVIGICKPTKAHPSRKPDLVIISYDANQIKEKLTGLGIKVVEQDAATSVAGALAQIRQLGVLSGHYTAANKLAVSINRTINADIASIPAHPTKVLNAYYELDPTFYSLTSSTFVGTLMKALGLVNIADAKSTSADAGYPQLSSEYIVSANPQLILLADTVCCQVTTASVAARPGFSTVSAVANGHVVAINDSVASEWGAHLGVLMNELTAAVKAALNDARLWG